ncbi:hypothetical protein HY967_04610 [Candidatus Jorgensenbacteria bacterium]|nr:hypothetical protein [Candidatus Jorgensenbacteria bacterium]
MFLKKIAIKTLSVTIGTIPLVTFAQLTTPVSAPITSITQLPTLLNSILGWFQAIFFGIAGIFIVLAAFGYLTAGGDEEKVRGAKQMLVYTAVALAVAVMATAVRGIVVTLLSV